MELRENVPLVDHGEAEVFKELARIFARRNGLANAGVGSGIGAEDESILAGQNGGPGQDATFGWVAGEPRLEEFVHRFWRVPVVEGNPRQMRS